MMSFLTPKGKTITIDQEPAQRMSQKAIAFGQHIVDLEEALEAAHDRISTLEYQLKVAEGDRDQIRSRLQTCEKDKDYFQKRWLETKAKLKSSASIILDAMREDDDPAGTYRPGPASIRAVEKALAATSDEKPPPIPEFLHAGPRETVE